MLDFSINCAGTTQALVYGPVFLEKSLNRCIQSSHCSAYYNYQPALMGGDILGLLIRYYRFYVRGRSLLRFSRMGHFWGNILVKLN
jgi:hypothetical protein